MSSASLQYVSTDFQTKPTLLGIISGPFSYNKEAPAPQTHLFHMLIYSRSFMAVGVQIKSVGCDDSLKVKSVILKSIEFSLS